MKRTVCLILAILMLLTAAGCGKKPGPVPAETQAPDQTEHSASASDAPYVTAAPAEPDETEYAPDPNADAAFREIDLDVFRSIVTSSTDCFNQYIAHDAAYFGIDPADVKPGWGEYSYEAHMESMEQCRGFLSRLSAVDRNSLSEANRRAYDVLKRSFEVELMYEDYYYYDEPLTPLNGMHTMLPLGMFLFNIRSLEDVNAYMTLIEDMPRMLGQLADFEEEKAREGLFMCETALDQVVRSCRDFASKGEGCFLITGFDRVADKARELGADEAFISSCTSRNRELVITKVIPAYTSLAQRLEAHRADCTPFVGAAARSEKARAYFELQARDEGASMDSMETITALIELMGQGTYNKLCFALVYGGDEILNKYAEGVEPGLGSVEADLEWLRGFVDEYYPPMPDYYLKYVDIPEDIAEDFSPAAYLQPPFDDYYNNLMLLNPSSESSDDIFTIAHEAIPGHMYQFLSARSNKDIPLSQQVLEPVGYAEGWTVFSEAFVATKIFDVGINYSTMLSCENIFFNIYLPAFISIKVNYEGWTHDDVVKMLSAYDLTEAADIFYEYAVTMPVYSMSYAVGYSYYYDIYEQIDPATPEDHKSFFGEYLSFGPMWMDMIRDEMLNG